MPREETFETIKRWISNDSQKHDWILNYLINNTELKLVWEGDPEVQQAGDVSPPWDWKIHTQVAQTQNGIATFVHYLYTRYRQGIIEYNKMKAAWSQKKYRSRLKSSNKKVYNFVMSSRVKRDLDFVAGAHREPLNRTIERLISEEAALLRAGTERHSNYLKDMSFEHPR